MDSRRDRGDAAGARAGFLERAGFWAIVLLVAALPGIGCSRTGSEIAWEPLVGGPCEYRSYPGQAEIVSVTPSTAASGRFDVRFRFIPDGVVEEPLGKSALERTFPLLPDREMPPDRAYVEQLDIRPGTRVGCTLRVITRGTCTPVLFDFPPPAPR
ncbi:MAG TPA: hypothetical protein PLT21_01060 [Syntrophales bacterium]|nr:hypothetical protein [Syntrophales bacterium]HPG70598.1 hypothetical protein [Syntrophales bacterium]